MLVNGTLIIEHVDESDVGVYHCVGTGTAGPVQTFAAELQLACECFISTSSSTSKRLNDYDLTLCVI